MPVAMLPAPTISVVPIRKAMPQPISTRRMPIVSRKALTTKTVMEKPRKADPSAAPIISPAAIGAIGSIHSAFRLLATAARSDALIEAVNSARTLSQKSLCRLIAVMSAPLPLVPPAFRSGHVSIVGYGVS